MEKEAFARFILDIINVMESTHADYLNRQAYRNKKIDENRGKVSRYPSSI